MPTTRWSSDKPLNFSPKPLTLSILCVGLLLFGLGESLIITASAGMSPWTVLAEGLSITSGLSIGALTFLISLGVLLLWIPLKQQAGIGTILNVMIIAAVIEWSLPYLPHPETYVLQIAQAIFGTLLVGVASGIYLIANLGPGTRDGLMTGISKNYNKPISLIRFSIEFSVVFLGWLLGGTLGIGTIIFAVFIGPFVSLSLKLVAFLKK